MTVDVDVGFRSLASNAWPDIRATQLRFDRRLIDCLHLAFVTHAVYTYAVIRFGDESGLLKLTWYVNIYLMMRKKKIKACVLGKGAYL